jgi:hypothetical protein
MPSTMIKFFQKPLKKLFFGENFLVILQTDLNNDVLFRYGFIRYVKQNGRWKEGFPARLMEVFSFE